MITGTTISLVWNWVLRKYQKDLHTYEITASFKFPVLLRTPASGGDTLWGALGSPPPTPGDAKTEGGGGGSSRVSTRGVSLPSFASRFADEDEEGSHAAAASSTSARRRVSGSGPADALDRLPPPDRARFAMLESGLQAAVKVCGECNPRLNEAGWV